MLWSHLHMTLAVGGTLNTNSLTHPSDTRVLTLKFQAFKRSQYKPCGLAFMNITWFMACIVNYRRYNTMMSISVIVNMV